MIYWLQVDWKIQKGPCLDAKHLASEVPPHHVFQQARTSLLQRAEPPPPAVFAHAQVKLAARRNEAPGLHLPPNVQDEAAPSEHGQAA